MACGRGIIPLRYKAGGLSDAEAFCLAIGRSRTNGEKPHPTEINLARGSADVVALAGPS